MSYKSTEKSSRNSYASFRSSVASMDAAALQSDIASRYSLPGSQMTIKRTPKAARSSTQNSRVKQTKACPSCQGTNLASNAVCRRCGYFMSGVDNSTISLAQHRGLVKKQDESKTLTLTQSQWKAIETDISKREDAYCPICMGGFNKGNEVLLSCSHMYHRNCLQSFEKFMKTAERCCPICRTSNYQKKVTHVGTTAYEKVCAITIQKNWRGHWCRCENYNLLRDFYRQGNGSSFKKKFFEKELTSFANQLERGVLQRYTEVDTMFQSMDKTVADNRQLDLEFELMLMGRRDYSDMIDLEDETVAVSTESSRGGLGEAGDKKDCGDQRLSAEEWEVILARSTSRKEGPLECAICMSEVHRGNRRVVLLSCSHLYHQRCILMLEDFVKEAEDPSCPMCRAPYQRRLLSRCLKYFDSAKIT